MIIIFKIKPQGLLSIGRSEALAAVPPETRSEFISSAVSHGRHCPEGSRGRSLSIAAVAAFCREVRANSPAPLLNVSHVSFFPRFFVLLGELWGCTGKYIDPTKTYIRTNNCASWLRGHSSVKRSSR